MVLYGSVVLFPALRDAQDHPLSTSVLVFFVGWGGGGMDRGDQASAPAWMELMSIFFLRAPSASVSFVESYCTFSIRW